MAECFSSNDDSFEIIDHEECSSTPEKNTLDNSNGTLGGALSDRHIQNSNAEAAAQKLLETLESILSHRLASFCKSAHHVIINVSDPISEQDLLQTILNNFQKSGKLEVRLNLYDQSEGFAEKLIESWHIQKVQIPVALSSSVSSLMTENRVFDQFLKIAGPKITDGKIRVGFESAD